MLYSRRVVVFSPGYKQCLSYGVQRCINNSVLIVSPLNANPSHASWTGINHFGKHTTQFILPSTAFMRSKRSWSQDCHVLQSAELKVKIQLLPSRWKGHRRSWCFWSAWGSSCSDLCSVTCTFKLSYAGIVFSWSFHYWLSKVSELRLWKYDC